MTRMLQRTFEHEFAAPPKRIWPLLANTARYNEATGMPRYVVEDHPQPDGTVRHVGHAAIAMPFGRLRMEWEEPPSEWVSGHWFSYQRYFSRGPAREVRTKVRFTETPDGGTHVRFTLWLKPSSWLSAKAIGSTFYKRAGDDFAKVCGQVEAWLAGQADSPYPAVDPAQEHNLRDQTIKAIEEVEASKYGHGLAQRLVEWMLNASETEIVRFRPLALARRWRVDPRHLVEACLQCVRSGLLELRWDLICPRCRGAKVTLDALDQPVVEPHCSSCNIAYDADFDRNIELTFRPAPQVREVADGEFCMLGPMTTPHVQIQLTVRSGASRIVTEALPAGHYRIRTLEPGPELDFHHDGASPLSLVLTPNDIMVPPTSGSRPLRVVNRGSAPRTLVIESRKWLRDTLTASQASTLSAFRDLFSKMSLRPGDEPPVSHLTLMFTDLSRSTALYERIGDGTAYGIVRRHFVFLADVMRAYDGTVVKTIGDAVMGAFTEPEQALKAALTLQRLMPAFNTYLAALGFSDPVLLKIGLHAGPCVAVTLNERLDYFGMTVNKAARLQNQCRGGDIVISEELAADSDVAAHLQALQPPPHQDVCALKGIDEPVPFHRIDAIVHMAVAPRASAEITAAVAMLHTTLTESGLAPDAIVSAELIALAAWAHSLSLRGRGDTFVHLDDIWPAVERLVAGAQPDSADPAGADGSPVAALRDRLQRYEAIVARERFAQLDGLVGDAATVEQIRQAFVTHAALEPSKHERLLGSQYLAIVIYDVLMRGLALRRQDEPPADPEAENMVGPTRRAANSA
ncbi:MAG: adenylate/guanylate cyclase domain-containing protein [Alphaproteobacteria bacterium]|nr:adenylate/guanylate cyclase domain-containing protein [Alphaproteobacteria bacterium]